MKLFFTSLSLILSCCLFTTAAHSDETVIDKSTGLIFPKYISFESGSNNYELEATGITTRKKLIIKIYSIVSYLQRPWNLSEQDKYTQIFSDQLAKQLTMKYVRDVTSSQLQDAFLESFKRVFQAEDYALMQGSIGEFLQYFKSGIHKGDEYVLRWIPGTGLEVFFNGTLVGNINNIGFTKGLWNIWFEKNGIVDGSDLVSFMK